MYYNNKSRIQFTTRTLLFPCHELRLTNPRSRHAQSLQTQAATFTTSQKPSNARPTETIESSTAPFISRDTAPRSPPMHKVPTPPHFTPSPHLYLTNLPFPFPSQGDPSSLSTTLPQAYQPQPPSPLASLASLASNHPVPSHPAPQHPSNQPKNQKSNTTLAFYIPEKRTTITLATDADDGNGAGNCHGSIRFTSPSPSPSTSTSETRGKVQVEMRYEGFL